MVVIDSILSVIMKRDKLCVFGGLALVVWLSITYLLFTRRPSSNLHEAQRLDVFKQRLDTFELELKNSALQTSQILDLLKDVQHISSTQKTVSKQGKSVIKGDEGKDLIKMSENGSSDQSNVIPVLMFACNRKTVNLAIDSLLKARKNEKKFPIIVSQDCAHDETANVIRSYGDKIIFIQQPDQSDMEVPANERKFKGYFKIARHYGWALNETLNRRRYEQVIIVEDDLEVAPDFFEYFEATLPILRSDPSLWCVSAWNDNGKVGIIDESKPELLYRSDFFGGLGWMMTRDLWMNELSKKWPKSYWDDWMRLPTQRRDRACIRPEISRTKTFGKIGVSNGMFFDKHLKFIKLNEKFVPFKSSNMDLSYLMKDTYDKAMDKVVFQETPVANLLDVKQGNVAHHPAVRLIYRTKESFKSIAKAIGIMDDFKSGVPRMAYKGVVSTLYRGQRVYVTPNLNWKGYDPSW